MDDSILADDTKKKDASSDDASLKDMVVAVAKQGWEDGGLVMSEQELRETIAELKPAPKSEE